MQNFVTAIGRIAIRPYSFPMNLKRLTIFALALAFFALPALAEDDYDEPSSGGGIVNSRTLGGTIYGSVQLVDTLPTLDPGIGGGVFFDNRFNDRFSIAIEAFAITQDGDGASGAENSIEFLGIPTATIKLYLLGATSKFDPYIGIGIGVYALTEGSIDNSSFGLGIGAQIETGLDYVLTDTLALSVGGVYRSVGLLNSLSGTANATTYMPYTLFGRIGYKF